METINKWRQKLQALIPYVDEGTVDLINDVWMVKFQRWTIELTLPGGEPRVPGAGEQPKVPAAVTEGAGTGMEDDVPEGEGAAREEEMAAAESEGEAAAGDKV